MKRRKLLRAAGTSSIGFSLAGNAASQNRPSFSKEDVELDNLDGFELIMFKYRMRLNGEVNSLIEKASKMGWTPNWDRLKVVKKSIESDSTQGSFYTAILNFERIGSNDDQVMLQWNTSNSIDLENSLDGVVPGANLTHIRYSDSKRDNSDEQQELRIDSIVEYRIEGDEVKSTSLNISQNEPIEQDVEISGIGSPDEPGKIGGGGGGPTYCEISVGIYEGKGDIPASCADLECIATNTGGSILAIATCIGSVGLACVASLGLSAYTWIDCISCEPQTGTTVKVEEGWFYNNYRGSICNGSVYPCECVSPDTDLYLPITECELDNKVPTKNNINYPEC